MNEASEGALATTRRTALVTGGNRGIGQAICKGLADQGVAVVLAARDPQAGAVAAGQIGPADAVRVEALDLADLGSVRDCADRLAAAGVAIDILVNNAAILPDGDALSVPDSDIDAAWAVNVRGAWLAARAFAPGMVARGWGRIVNLSSGWGSFAEGLSGPAAYSVTKAALNALTVSLARTLPATVKVNSLCPGWVRTRMGGPAATRSPEEGADTAVWLACLPDDGPTGGFFRSRQPIDW